jgi:hypothetical protein
VNISLFGRKEINMNGTTAPEEALKDAGYTDSSPSVTGAPAQTKIGRFCIPCAVKNPGFKERAPSLTGAPFEDAAVRAWIGGRGFDLVRHPSMRLVCERCGQEVPAIYAPEEQQAA